MLELVPDVVARPRRRARAHARGNDDGPEDVRLGGVSTGVEVDLELSSLVNESLHVGLDPGAVDSLDDPPRDVLALINHLLEARHEIAEDPERGADVREESHTRDWDADKEQNCRHLLEVLVRFLHISDVVENCDCVHILLGRSFKMRIQAKGNSFSLLAKGAFETYPCYRRCRFC